MTGIEEFKTPPIMDVQKESLKLFKMTKCYNWEIKLLDVDLDRLEKINSEMIKKFGTMEI